MEAALLAAVLSCFGIFVFAEEVPPTPPPNSPDPTDSLQQTSQFPGSTQSTAAAQQPLTAPEQIPLPSAPKPASTAPPTPPKKFECTAKPCEVPIINSSVDWYKRFANGPQVKPLTPKEKAWLATKNLIDPFNLLTILGIDAISVAADSHSAYGPGFPGWGRNVGVSFTEDITGEFFGTFLLPTITHQDPHYHRMPHASYKRRIFHAIYQVAWTQGDNGKNMLNYSALLASAIDGEIGNLYVPGRQTNGSATAQRYGIGLATAPIDNFITEFLPDVARRIHVHAVIVQRIINQVASKDAAGS
jgi:hypothetical protein